MASGIFSNLGKSYFKAAKNTLYYTGNLSFLLKPFALLIALGYGAILLPIGLIFYALIILDWIGNITDSLRKYFIGLMQEQSCNIDNSFFSFIIRPILILILSPLFLISVCIPKLSSNIVVDMTANEASGMLNGVGTFKKINGIVLDATKRLFDYVAKTHLLLKPINAGIAIIYSIVLLFIATLFLLLIPIDWISKLIESIRMRIVDYANRQQNKIRYEGFSFLVAPLLLVVLSPIFLAMILIPKVATQLDVEI